MMKVRFLQDYQGQHTGPHFYQAGQVADLDDSVASRLIADKRAEVAAQDYSKYTVGMLRDELGRRGLSTKGNKPTMIARLENNN